MLREKDRKREHDQFLIIKAVVKHIVVFWTLLISGRSEILENAYTFLFAVFIREGLFKVLGIKGRPSKAKDDKEAPGPPAVH